MTSESAMIGVFTTANLILSTIVLGLCVDSWPITSDEIWCENIESDRSNSSASCNSYMLWPICTSIFVMIESTLSLLSIYPRFYVSIVFSCVMAVLESSAVIAWIVSVFKISTESKNKPKHFDGTRVIEPVLSNWLNVQIMVGVLLITQCMSCFVAGAIAYANITEWYDDRQQNVRLQIDGKSVAPSKKTIEIGIGIKRKENFTKNVAA